MQVYGRNTLKYAQNLCSNMEMAVLWCSESLIKLATLPVGGGEQGFNIKHILIVACYKSHFHPRTLRWMPDYTGSSWWADWDRTQWHFCSISATEFRDLDGPALDISGGNTTGSADESIQLDFYFAQASESTVHAGVSSDRFSRAVTFLPSLRSRQSTNAHSRTRFS